MNNLTLAAFTPSDGPASSEYLTLQMQRNIGNQRTKGIIEKTQVNPDTDQKSVVERDLESHLAVGIKSLPGSQINKLRGSGFSLSNNNRMRLEAGLGVASNVAFGVGTALNLYDMVTAPTRLGAVQSGADTLTSAAGFLGPVGSAFSGGYAGGSLIAKHTKADEAIAEGLYD